MLGLVFIGGCFCIVMGMLLDSPGLAGWGIGLLIAGGLYLAYG